MGKNAKVIVFESDTEIIEVKRDPKGKPVKFIKKEDWGDDPKKLRKEAEKI